MSFYHQYYQFILAQGICSPIGASAIFYPAMSTVSTWFFRHRALAFGVMASGSSLGGVIFPILVQRLIPRIGFPWAMRVAAFLILGCLVVANLTVKSRLPPNPKPFVLKDFVRPLRELPYTLIVTASFFFFFGIFIPFDYIILQAQAAGMSANLASYLLAILNAASIIGIYPYLTSSNIHLLAKLTWLITDAGRILPGHLADRYGRFNIMIIMSYFSGIIVLALWLPARANAPIIIFAALYGFGSGAFVSMAPALIAQVSDIREIGIRSGTMFAIISVAALVGNPIGGALIANQGGGFSHIEIFCGIFLLVGSTLFVAARWSVAGWGLKKKV